MVRLLYIMIVLAVISAGCAAKKKQKSQSSMERLVMHDSLQSSAVQLSRKDVNKGTVRRGSVYSNGLRLVGFTGLIRSDGSVEGTADEAQSFNKGKTDELQENIETHTTDSLQQIVTIVSDIDDIESSEKSSNSDRKSNHIGVIVSLAIAVVIMFLGLSWAKKVA